MVVSACPTVPLTQLAHLSTLEGEYEAGEAPLPTAQ